MRNFLILAILSSFCFVGCASKVKYYPVYQVKLIERPKSPKLLPLNEKKHLGHVDNVDIMLENITRLLDYSEALNGTIDKYEIQGKPTVEQK